MSTDQITFLYIVILAFGGWFWYNDHQTRKQLEKRLAELQELQKHTGEQVDQYRNIKLAIDFAYDSIMITLPDERVLYANDSVIRMTGFSRREIIGARASRHWGSQESPKFYQLLIRRVKIDKKPFLGQIVNRRKNGELYQARISVAPILDVTRKRVMYFVAVERDQTPWAEPPTAKKQPTKKKTRR